MIHPCMHIHIHIKTKNWKEIYWRVNGGLSGWLDYGFWLSSSYFLYLSNFLWWTCVHDRIIKQQTCVCVCVCVCVHVWLKTAHTSIWKSPGEKSPFCCHSSLCLSGVSCFEWGGGGKEGWGEGDQGLWREGRVQSRAGVVGMKSASFTVLP